MTKRSNMSGTAAHDGAERKRPEACSLSRVLVYQLVFAEAGREMGNVGVTDGEVHP